MQYVMKKKRFKRKNKTKNKKEKFQEKKTKKRKTLQKHYCILYASFQENALFMYDV